MELNVIDVAALAKTAQSLEEELLKTYSPEQTAEYMKKRAFSAEKMLQQIQLQQAQAEVLKKFPLVDPEDVADATTLAEMEKLAAKAQRVAERASSKKDAEFKEITKDLISSEELDRAKKAYGSPRVAPVEDTNSPEQAKLAGQAKEDPIKYGDMAAVKEAASRGSLKALEMMFGEGK